MVHLLLIIYLSFISLGLPDGVLGAAWPSMYGGLGVPVSYAGILSMGIAYSLQNIGQKNLDSATASLLMSTESVFAVLAGWIVLHERLSFWEGIGCILVFGAVVLSQLPDKTSKKQAM